MIHEAREEDAKATLTSAIPYSIPTLLYSNSPALVLELQFNDNNNIIEIHT